MNTDNIKIGREGIRHYFERAQELQRDCWDCNSFTITTNCNTWKDFDGKVQSSISLNVYFHYTLKRRKESTCELFSFSERDTFAEADRVMKQLVSLIKKNGYEDIV